MAALQTTLKIVKESIDDVPVPGLKSAVGGLLEVIVALEVSPSNRTGQKSSFLGANDFWL